MTDQAAIIEKHPIGNNLDAFRSSFNSICADKTLCHSPDALGQLDQEDLRNLALPLLFSLQRLPVSGLLRSKTGRSTLRSDVLRLISAVASEDFDFGRIKPLLSAVIANEPDIEIWKRVDSAGIESTPPPRPIPSSLQQTPWLRNTSSFANSSEHRKYVDAVLKEELGPMYVGLRSFHETFFGGVAGLQTASEVVFKKCMEGNSPLFRIGVGWRGWPEDADRDCVLGWFADLSEKLATFAEPYKSTATCQRRPLAKPNEPIGGSIGKRKMDVGYVNDPKAKKHS